MSKVFVTQKPTPNRIGWFPDLSPAKEYGEIVYVFQGNENAACNQQKAVSDARRRLKEFNPESDFICWPNNGDPAVLYVIIMVLVDMGHRDLTYLYWNRYRERDGTPIKSSGYYSAVKIRI